MSGEASDPTNEDNISIDPTKIEYVEYSSEKEHLPGIMSLIEKDLSEPYSIYTYRYFINNWPGLCYMATYEGRTIGVVVSKLDNHRGVERGYIAMLAVEKQFRKQKIGTALVKQCIEVMSKNNCEEVALEAEITNYGAISLYMALGFVKDKRLYRYYMNGADALRLKLFLPLLLEHKQQQQIESAQQ